MKHPLRWFLAAIVICAVFVFFNWPSVRFHAALFRLSVNPGGPFPAERATIDGLSVDTFTDDVSSKTVGDLYYAACSRLESLRNGYPRRTYRWFDGEGWDRITSVVQFPTGYLSATAAINNDNDSVCVQLGPGTFPPSTKEPTRFLELKELPDDRLPPNTLRFQQPARP